ncbi:hypothetical protein [Paractinoplanes atraurantiacus]|uniref:Uncharacterized protein n=1 Tax=Paractinoplanes atraurantiacus TaxID=1036182 RepID=A0A285IF58_9ACTN|nr:hypothetical protein [Actinoplanes atraurantiacus]SNY45581.1 hypothetical protein SAMN05421748_107254 [Actinoplanes atraurantiacus]
MSDGEFWTYAGLLGLSGLVLLVLCVTGFGQSGFLRGVDALLGLGFLGYAGYLALARPDDPFTFYYIFALPVLAVIYALVCLRRVVKLRRLAARFIPDPYAGETGDAHTERAPFPTPPSPLSESSPADAPDAPPPPPVKRGPMPSGLPSRMPPPADRPGRPSGLPEPPSPEQSPSPSLSPPRSPSPALSPSQPPSLSSSRRAELPDAEPSRRGLPSGSPAGPHLAGLPPGLPSDFLSRPPYESSSGRPSEPSSGSSFERPSEPSLGRPSERRLEIGPADYAGRHSAPGVTPPPAPPAEAPAGDPRNSADRFPQSPRYTPRSYEQKPAEGGRHRAAEPDDADFA